MSKLRCRTKLLSEASNIHWPLTYKMSFDVVAIGTRDMFEKREIVERDRCQIEAEIVLPESSVRMPYLVIDISERGARLQLPEYAMLPQSFHLALPIAADIFDRRSVEVRWRKENMVGLRFRAS